MKSVKKLITLLLALALLCGLLAGCGGEKAEPTAQPKATDTPATASGMVYAADYEKLPEELGSMDSLTLVGDSYYGSGWSSEAERNVFWRVAADFSSFEEVTNFPPVELPEGVEGEANIQSICAAPDGSMWLAEYAWTYHYEFPEGMSEADFTEDIKYKYQVSDSNVNTLRRVSESGELLAEVDLTAIAEASEYFSVGSLCCDAQGNVYFTDNEASVYAFDETGKSICTLSVENWISSLVTLSDGRVAAGAYGMNGFEVSVVDPAARSWGESFPVENVNNLYTGGGDYLFLYDDGTSLFGWDTAKAEGVRLLRWLDCDVDNQYINGVSIAEDGTVTAMSRNWNDNSTERITLSLRPASEVQEKTAITLATLYLSYELRAQVLEFNRSNEQYRIDVKDYSEYNTDEDYNAGLTKLNTEIIAGTIPDILDVSQLPVKQYISKGLFEDLYPYIDADGELSRDSFITPVMSAIEVDGGLFQATSSFGVFTVLGRTEMVGEEMGWTLDEMLSLLDDAPEGTELFDTSITRMDILNYMCYMNMDRYVNWQTGESSFDSQDFKDVLRFCSSFPEEFNYDESSYESEPSRVMAGKQLLSMFGAYDFTELQMYEAMYGGDITFKGFPRAEGVGNTVLVNEGLAISTTSEYKDAAWSFVRTVLTEEYQTENVYNFPTNKAAFDAKLKEAMTPEYYTDPETGEQVESSKGGMGWEDFSIEFYALKQDEADKIMELINSIDGQMVYDNSVFEIVSDEVAAYFAGQKSEDETAKLIQSRVSIYVNEQK